ncbi:MAG: energy-coupling factor transporter transmembrane component T [Desulfatiglandaceae bacterium]
MKRFDPRTKLALGIMGIAAVLLTRNTFPLAVEMVLLLGGLLTLKMLRPLVRVLKLILPLVGLVFVIALISFAWETALVLALRLFNLFTLSFVFFQALDPEELGDGLRKMGLPYEFSFILTTSMRYVPLIGMRIRLIADAQRSRGIDLRPRLRNVPRFMALLMPLLVQAFILAEQLAMAMESRGFARKGRSFRRGYRIPLHEYGLMFLALCLLATFVIWERG